jgi:hypothetical protein
MSVGKFWYVVAEIVFAEIAPVDVNPVTVLNKTENVPPVLFLYVKELFE